MAKKCSTNVLDNGLNYVANNGDAYALCAGEPLNYADVATKTLASTTLTLGAGGGDYTLAAGDTSGRKLTVAAQTGLSVTASGTADHVAITDGVGELIYVTTLASSQAVTSGNTADVGAWDIEIADPV